MCWGVFMGMIEIRWHSRGGQGAWTASNILAMAAIKEGKHTQSFPEFGPERMGAAMHVFTRISDEPIEIHSAVYTPDVLVVLDPTLLSPKITRGLKENGVIVVNYGKDPESLYKILNIEKGKYKVYKVSATELAVKILGRGITNTAMIGALIKAVPLVKLESVIEAVKERFPGELGERNVKVVQEAYEKTVEV